MQKVTYQDDALLIRIPTNCPAALHRQLLKGLVTTMKLSIISDDATTNEDVDGLIALTQCFKALLPTEVQLEAANG